MQWQWETNNHTMLKVIQQFTLTDVQLVNYIHIYFILCYIILYYNILCYIIYRDNYVR